jgi:hypothetical protein
MSYPHQMAIYYHKIAATKSHFNLEIYSKIIYRYLRYVKM